MSYYSDDQARLARNSNDVFNNRVKVIVFLIAFGTGLVTIWDKCSSSTHHVVTAADSTRQRAEDSAANAHRPPTITSSRRRHVKVEPKTAGSGVKTQNDDRTVGGVTPAGGDKNQQVKSDGPSVGVPRVVRPLQTTEVEDIEFTLLSAEGSSRAQTIRMTVVLTNHAANRFIWSAVESMSDADGNEYLLKSFTNGASSYDNHIPLDTEVPRKCTYTFGGVLPSVKTIRLFKFRYRHKSLDDPNVVEFRDIPIDWR
jgi:hypothetical protein